MYKIGTTAEITSNTFRRSVVIHFLLELKMGCTDQPGRLLAVLVVAPAMAWMGVSLHRGRHILPIATCLCVFAVVFFFYELYWLTCRPPRQC